LYRKRKWVSTLKDLGLSLKKRKREWDKAFKKRGPFLENKCERNQTGHKKGESYRLDAIPKVRTGVGGKKKHGGGKRNSKLALRKKQPKRGTER